MTDCERELVAATQTAGVQSCAIAALESFHQRPFTNARANGGRDISLWQERIHVRKPFGEKFSAIVLWIALLFARQILCRDHRVHERGRAVEHQAIIRFSAPFPTLIQRARLDPWRSQ